MPDFPALTPASRTFTPGSYLQQSYQSLNGRQTNVAHSNAMISSQLRLRFIGLTEAEMLQISSHYHGQYGPHLPFRIPTEIFSGFPGIVVGTGEAGDFGSYLWRYLPDGPSIEELGADVGDLRFTVSIGLETVPPQGAIVAGLAANLFLSLAAGTVTASSSVAGATLTVTASLSAGAAIAYLVDGAALTITASLDDGAATASSNAGGATLASTLSLSPGAASS